MQSGSNHQNFQIVNHYMERLSDQLEVPLLQDLGYEKLTTMINSVFDKNQEQTGNLVTIKEVMKPYLLLLPGISRTLLLERVLNSYPSELNKSYPHILFAVELLFSARVTSIDISITKNFRQEHVDTLLRVLSEDGKGLETLELEKSASTSSSKLKSRNSASKPVCIENNYGYLHNIFVSASNISTLALRNFCDDSVMQLIGECCKSLVTLDITCSKVTDKGYHWLTQNIIRLEPQGHADNAEWTSSFWKLPDIFLPLEQLVPSGEDWKCYDRCKSPLCQTLKTIILDRDAISNCNISFGAILMILEMIPDLQEFEGMCLENFFSDLRDELDDKTEQDENFSFPPVNLTSVYIFTIDNYIFDIMSSLCPKLRHFQHTTMNPYWESVPLSKFNSLPFLETLIMDEAISGYTREEFSELSPNIKKQLKILKLGWGGRNAKVLSLAPFISEFPLLETLSLNYPDFKWYCKKQNNTLTLNVLPYLKYIKLIGKVTAEVVYNLLGCTPNLEKISIEEIIERPEDFLEKLWKVGNRKLESFKVKKGYFLNNQQDLDKFLTYFPRVKTVGRLAFN